MTNLIVEYKKDNSIKELECSIDIEMDIETFMRIVKTIEISAQNDATTKFNSVKTNEIISVKSKYILCVKSIDLGVKKTFKEI